MEAKTRLSQRAKLWVGSCALVIAVAVLGTWQIWIGLLLALPVLVASFAYAGYVFFLACRQEKRAAVETETLSPREQAAAHFSTFPQVLRLVAAAALMLNLALFATMAAVATMNGGYVGPDYELSGVYLSYSSIALASLGSLATLSVLGLTIGIVHARSVQILAGEREALAQHAGVERLIKFARIFNTVTIIAFLVATVGGFLALVISSAH